MHHRKLTARAALVFCPAVDKGDPAARTVDDGKLYLNYTLDMRKTWAEDIPGNIAKADGHWPGVLN